MPLENIVYVPGVWDLFHVGHLQMLKHCKQLACKGTVIVGVPSDAVVEADKGFPPIIPLSARLAILRAIRIVTIAVPYMELDFISHLKTFKPDILAVSYATWGNLSRHREAEHWIETNGKRIVKLPYYKYESTSKIKERIRSG